MDVPDQSNPVAEYEARFGNLDEIYPPAIWGDPRFRQLAAEALRLGRRISLPEVQAILPQAQFETEEE